MNENAKLTATEVAVIVGCSLQTLNIWYRFKRENPDNEFAKILPEFTQSSSRQTRYWKEEDISKIIDFKNSVVKGRNGFLSSVTQKYLRKG